MARLFGTDGVRGIANADLNCELAMKIGAYGAHVFAREGHNPRILLGMDTRRSGDMLSAALTAGICSVGGDVIMLGMLPTPALAYLVRLYEADAAVMVSASHNTMEYNGIKWFDGAGYKLSVEMEDKIERLINENAPLALPVGEGVGNAIDAPHALEEYKDFLKSAAEADFSGIRVVLDCANGSASSIAKDVFCELGAGVICHGNEPNGNNINENCGSTYPMNIQKLVLECGGDVGFAFDGDADRLIAADELGAMVDGDKIIGICAEAMQKNDKLHKNTVVITVMSNIGLKKRMMELGIRIEETTVGDRYVMETMRENGYNLGGEQSGHIIFLDNNTTGDGILTAIKLTNILVKSGLRMSSLASRVPIYPQVLVNVRVDNSVKEDAMLDESILAYIGEVKATLGQDGRVLVRASGTEPLIRVMLEGSDEGIINKYAIKIAKRFKQQYDGKIKK